MPSTGAPTNTWYPNDSEPVAPLENLFLQLAVSVNIWGAGIQTAVDALVAGPGRGTRAVFQPASPAAIIGLNSAVGDIATPTAVDAGIDRMPWFKFASTPTWYPIGQIAAATLAQMTTFIATIAGITGLSFKVGELWYDKSTKIHYRFLGAGGSYEVALEPKSLIKYTAAAAVPWPVTPGAIVSGISTAVKADTSAWTRAAGVFTCVRAGTYTHQAKLTLLNLASNANIYFRKNGTIAEGVMVPGTTSHYNTGVLVYTDTFAVGDTVDLFANGGSAANAGFASAAYNNHTITNA